MAISSLLVAHTECAEEAAQDNDPVHEPWRNKMRIILHAIDRDSRG
jgi:hypothetical protein